ncbi:MAG: hypothetical protein FWF57_00565 [Defluviitaleaceae bacterium]|nr:hypothetical protein [Defluviitaleaceae bacterium]
MSNKNKKNKNIVVKSLEFLLLSVIIVPMLIALFQPQLEKISNFANTYIWNSNNNLDFTEDVKNKFINMENITDFNFLKFIRNDEPYAIIVTDTKIIIGEVVLILIFLDN